MTQDPLKIPAILAEAAERVRQYAQTVQSAQTDFLADLIRIKSYTGEEGPAVERTLAEMRACGFHVGPQLGGNPVIEEIEEGKGLRRAARLGGDDKKRARGVQYPRQSKDRSWIGAVQHAQIERALFASKGLGKDLGS